jgi:hypothetical protein
MVMSALPLEASDELTDDATVRGFYGEVVEAAEPYGGVEGYVRHELESDL